MPRRVQRSRKASVKPPEATRQKISYLSRRSVSSQPCRVRAKHRNSRRLAVEPAHGQISQAGRRESFLCHRHQRTLEACAGHHRRRSGVMHKSGSSASRRPRAASRGHHRNQRKSPAPRRLCLRIDATRVPGSEASHRARSGASSAGWRAAALSRCRLARARNRQRSSRRAPKPNQAGRVSQCGRRAGQRQSACPRQRTG